MSTNEEGNGSVSNPPPAPTGNGAGSNSADKLILPRSCVKRIMKLNEDVKVVSAESSVAVAKATEQFIDLLVNKAYQTCISHNRKTLKFEDILEAIDSEENVDQFQFLYDAFGISAPRS